MWLRVGHPRRLPSRPRGHLGQSRQPRGTLAATRSFSAGGSALAASHHWALVPLIFCAARTQGSGVRAWGMLRHPPLVLGRNPELFATPSSLWCTQDAEAERLWGACALYLARKLWSRGPGAPATALNRAAEQVPAGGTAEPLTNGEGVGEGESVGGRSRAPAPAPAFTLSQLLHALDLP